MSRARCCDEEEAAWQSREVKWWWDARALAPQAPGLWLRWPDWPQIGRMGWDLADAPQVGVVAKYKPEHTNETLPHVASPPKSVLSLTHVSSSQQLSCASGGKATPSMLQGCVSTLSRPGQAEGTYRSYHV